MSSIMEAARRVRSFVVSVFMVVVDETRAVEELVREGDFDLRNSNIVSCNFPNPKNGRRSGKELVLFHFGKSMFSEEAIAEMDKENCEPATIWDLLAFAKAKPSLQRQFPIVAIEPSVPYLYGDYDVRGVDLHDFAEIWPEHCHFLGRRRK